MSLRMPEPDAAILGRRERIVATLRTIVPGEGVIATEREMRPYESDGLTAYRQLPMVVVLPETTEQVAQILRYCHAEGIKVVPRGAGTSLSGARCRSPMAFCWVWRNSIESSRSISKIALQLSNPA